MKGSGRDKGLLRRFGRDKDGKFIEESLISFDSSNFHTNKL